MRVISRSRKLRTFLCINCRLVFTEDNFTSEDENGNDLCPACGGVDFKEVSRKNIKLQDLGENI